MRGPRILRTAAFRIAILYAALFALGAAVLIGFVDVSVGAYARRAVRDDVRDEMRLLLKTAPGGEAAAVARLVGAREQILGSQDFLYLVTGPDGRRLAGELPRGGARTGWSSVEVAAPADEREYPGERAEALTLGSTLPGGGLVVVGRSTYGLHELSETLITASAVAAALISLMSMGVALLIGRRFLTRIDEVSAAAGRIIEGDFGQRLPAIGMGDEFDRLAASLNRMLDRMQQLMNGLRQVSSDIAHDLRTPLGRLRQHLEDARARATTTADYDAATDAAIEEADELLETFSALLRIAQVEAGAQKRGFADVDLSELVKSVGEAYQPAAEDSEHTLDYQIEDGVHLTGDRQLLAQMISNLVENALRHTPAGSTVSLALRRTGPGFEIEVADNGPGIPETEHERVFTRFYRLDRSRSTAGSGLGLALVKAIAGLHGLTIRLEDKKPGLGVVLAG
jgi:signal transduction histidine kinase